ncbi:MAG: hypothetical protein JJ872_08945 [Marivivens sp.]|nr:hypothetical protein [Marivivens sp.]
MIVAFHLANTNESSPAYKRLSALKTAFEEAGTATVWAHEPGGDKADLDYFSYPPFPRLKDLPRLLLARRPYVLEYRDGWALAISTGYGNTVPAKRAKALLVGLIEAALRLRAYRVVTVTPGLLRWHGVARTILLPNGSEIDFSVPRRDVDLSKNVLNVVCFGKFLSYGHSNVMAALETLSRRYEDKTLNIHVYSGVSEETDLEHQFANIIVTRKDPVRPTSLIDFFACYDLGLAIIRDPDYDFGTKIFDYAQAGLPIVDYFDVYSDIKTFFAGAFDTDAAPVIQPDYSRAAMLATYDVAGFASGLEK